MQIDVKALNSLLERLDENYNINSGGCCFVAYVLARNLDALGIKYRTLFISDYDVISYFKNKRKEVRWNIKNRLKDVFPSGRNNCSHYAIKLSKTKEIINLGGFALYSKVDVGCLNNKDILSIYDQGHWNDDYDVSYNPIVDGEITKFFSQYW